jgi:hypothetical protein
MWGFFLFKLKDFQRINYSKKTKGSRYFIMIIIMRVEKMGMVSIPYPFLLLKNSYRTSV